MSPFCNLFTDDIDQKPKATDAFISCSPTDDGWVKENIIRVLCNLPHCLTIKLNKYENQERESNMILNMQTLKNSPVFIAVCSKQYSADPNGRLRYEREIAYRYGIKLIPIVLPNCSMPSDIYDAEPIYVGEGVNGFPNSEFYEVLLKEIAGGYLSHIKAK